MNNSLKPWSSGFFLINFLLEEKVNSFLVWQKYLEPLPTFFYTDTDPNTPFTALDIGADHFTRVGTADYGVSKIDMTKNLSLYFFQFIKDHSKDFCVVYFSKARPNFKLQSFKKLIPKELS